MPLLGENKMRKISVALLITILAASCFTVLISQAVAQSTAPTNPSITPPPLIIRWMRYHGGIAQWGNDQYQGSITVNAKTANIPRSLFKPWVTVEAFWSNQAPFPATKPAGQGEYSFTGYNARLVALQSIRKQNDFIVNVTGLWNIKEIKTTIQFNQNGVPIETLRELTPILTQAKGQLLITSDWKSFTISIEGADTLQGAEISMMTTTNPMNPFSFSAGPQANFRDLMQVMGGFRAVPGLANYNPDLDCNKDSKIDLADLTTVAANM
jgi:hypothetical protein